MTTGRVLGLLLGLLLLGAGGGAAWAEDGAAFGAGPPAGPVARTVAPLPPPPAGPALARADEPPAGPPAPPPPPPGEPVADETQAPPAETGAAATAVPPSDVPAPLPTDGPPAPAGPPVIVLERDGGATGAALPGVQDLDRVLRAGPEVACRCSQPRLSGRYTARYQGRWETDDDEDDHDLYQYLVLRLGDENRDRFAASFHGRLTWDIDGRDDTGSFYAFDSVEDTYSSRWNGKVYHLYGSWRPERGPLRQLRLGRMFLEAGELMHMDGAQVNLVPVACPFPLEVSVFGGVPARLWSDPVSGDWMAGITAIGRPWRGGEVRFDYAHIDQETYLTADENADLFTLTVRQQLSTLYFQTGYQHLDDDPRYAWLMGDWNVPNLDLFVRGSFRSLLSAQGQLVYDLDPFFPILLDLEPYWDGHLSVSKGWWETLYAEVGVTSRQLFHQADESTYNHEWVQYYGSLSTQDWLARGLSFTLTGEVWNSDDDVYTWGFEIDYHPSSCLRLTLGTDYAAWRFDFYSTDERQNSRSVYFRTRWTPTRNLTLLGRLVIEDDDIDSFVRVDAGFEVTF